MSAPVIAADVVAIDMHVHFELDSCGHDSLPAEIRKHLTQHFKAAPPPTLDATARLYRELHMAAVVFTVDAEAATGHPALSNVELAEQAAAHPGVLIPFASIDPTRGAAGVREARRLVEQHGVQGFKFHPSLQDFDPRDSQAYRLYAEIETLGKPAVFHTGQTGVGAGMRGGAGIRLGRSNPMLIDDVAVDFPDLKIVLAHPSFPWQDEAIAVATHKPNVYIDLSGWSPKYLPESLIRHANTVLRHKVLFGTDYPLITPDRWLTEFAKLPIRPEVLPLILHENARRLFGIAPPPQ